MNFIKKHKKEFILFVIAVLIILFCGITFVVMWFAGSSDIYGNRLEGIEEVKLSDSYIKDIEGFIKEKDFVTKVNHNLEGRLLSFMVTVSDEVDIETAKQVGTIVINNLSEDELKYYDIQLYLLDSNTKEESRFPFIGYKHKTSEGFIWSNN